MYVVGLTGTRGVRGTGESTIARHKGHRSHHVSQTRPLTCRDFAESTNIACCLLLSTFKIAMDPNPFKSHSTRTNFFSRVYTTPKPSNSSHPYLSTTRPHVNTPSFFAKSHIPQPAGRSPESHIASATLQGGDSSSSLHPSATEDSSIYASHETHQYFSHSVEDTNSQHPHDKMDGITHEPLPPRLEPAFYASRPGTPDVSLSSLEL
jgi:hypothetical protein